ncbi:MAG TPA: hypothetical protein VFR90_15350 [Methylibium sp.]|uniref:hypothetical protein n=1 Tax=Methylibium sp. TaxID=2067992 RepID=UPI002DBD9321|nr:hypothetical protein [Methylibium sp.]HEU4460496.1 hypothetical protein [Methylibium sp.]
MNATAPHPLADDAALRHCRRLVRRQALKAAGVSALPVAGVDLFVNAHLLKSTIDEISSVHGLAPQQIAALPPALRTRVDDLAAEVGSYLIGRVVTQQVLFGAVRALGVRLSAQQAAKLAPVAGLAASAALSGWMFKRLCDRHIEQCRRVQAALPRLAGPQHEVIDLQPGLHH